VALISPPLRKRITRLERSAGRRTTPGSRARAQQTLARLRARAQRQIEDATIYDPGASLSGPDLRRAVNAEVETQRRPLLREKAGLEALGKETSGNIEAGFAKLAESYAGSIGQSRALTQGATGAQRQIGERSQQALAAITQAAPGQQQLVAQRMAEQQGVSGARESQAQQLGDSTTDFLQKLAGSAQLQGQQLSSSARQLVASRVAEKLGEISDIEGPGRQKILGERIGQERQWLGEKAAFGINAQRARQQGAYQRASLRQRERASERTRQTATERLGFDRQKDAYQRQHKTGPYKPPSGKTPEDVQSAYDIAFARARAMDREQSFFNKRNPRPIHIERRERAVDLLVQEYRDDGLTRPLARRIVERIAEKKGADFSGGRKRRKR